MTRTYVRRPVKESASSLLTGHRLYRLDVELGRLEFLVHPAMGQEDLLVRGAGAAPRTWAMQRTLPVTPLPGLPTRPRAPESSASPPAALHVSL